MHSPAIQPRVCGDYIESKIPNQSHPDTTPHVRGLRSCGYHATHNNRYNPACAGTTSSESAIWSVDAIPPRVCGDYFHSAISTLMTRDTTPRVRGLPLARCYSLRVCRYNPACAGTTPGEQRILEIPPIQPRVCGDYNPEICSLARRNDTTPRVRGLHSNAFPATLAKRYNPACAGTTAATTTTSSPRPIQPRVCGDYRSQRVFMSSAFDTTPRVRGLRKKMCFIAIWERYNPACAGTTLLRSSRCKP